jgi:glycerol 2-dehydrogenase (NADP+)
LCDASTGTQLTLSQYSKKYLEELLPHATIIPAVNQIENHPELPQQEIVDFCKEKGIHIEAYSPLGSTGGPVMTAAPVVKIAEKRGVSASTVLLSYHGKSLEPTLTTKLLLICRTVARGSTVLAKSVTPERITANKTIIDLDEEDVKALNDYSAELQKKGELKRYVYPPFGIDFGFPDKS